MKVILQRVNEASVTVNNNIVGKIDNGLLILVGFTHGDTDADIDYIYNKIIHLRIFDDENGIMNKSLLDIGGAVLSVSQFTLYGDTKNGRRPSWVHALGTDEATIMYDKFNEKFNDDNIKINKGIFGAEMKVCLINDGPVTIVMESRDGSAYE